MKRTLPPLILSKTPLIFVLTQIRVAPITRIESHLPAIQEALRHKGFPHLAKRKFQINQTRPDGQALTRDRVQWEFLTPERKTSVLIDEASLVLQTTDYSSGETFLERLQVALEVFADIAKPTDLVRIGLRYVDLVKPIADRGLDDLVSPALRPTAQTLPGSSVVHYWESLRQTSPHTRLLVRYTEAMQGFAFPQDLGPIVSLVLRHEPAQKDLFGLLDTDHFDERGSPFKVSDIMDRTADLHDIIDQSFRQLVTPVALETWK
ncbi:MAG: TIGR04255 family protein [Opitutaceae bacterium]